MLEEKLLWLKDFTTYLIRRFHQDKCPSIAAELTVTTLLSLVPLLTIIFTLLALFPQFQSLSGDIKQLILSNVIPEQTQAIESKITEYIGNTKGLTWIGGFFLVITSLMLMRKIDQSFNQIWQVKRVGSRVRVFLVYWAVLTMGPLLVAMSLGISSYFASLPLISDVVNESTAIIKRGLPILLTFIAFTIMFIVVPNRRIRLKHAATAALVTALLFETAKWGFGVFVREFSTYQLIFGAVAAVPLFLIWILLSWMIILFGAEICHGLDVFQPHKGKDADNEFLIAARILKYLIEAQKNKQLVTKEHLQQNLNNVTKDDLSHVLDKLVQTKLILLLDSGGYSLSGDSKDYQLSDIFHAGIRHFPDLETIQCLQKTDSELLTKLETSYDALITSLNQSFER